ncbi:unnamed protein product [Diplocarpon coronariae]|nr:hypothetical protein JHW43_008378 [Diplocarpon mali]
MQSPRALYSLSPATHDRGQAMQINPRARSGCERSSSDEWARREFTGQFRLNPVQDTSQPRGKGSAWLEKPSCPASVSGRSGRIDHNWLCITAATDPRQALWRAPRVNSGGTLLVVALIPPRLVAFQRRLSDASGVQAKQASGRGDDGLQRAVRGGARSG